MRIIAVDGSPTGHGRTRAVVDHVLTAAAAAGADTAVVELAGKNPEQLAATAASLTGADGFVLASPTYRATYAWPLKALLDHVPRGMWGETEAPLQGRPVAIVATGASLHHFLGLGDLRNLLAGFFAAHVLPPGLYVPHEGLVDGVLQQPYDQQASAQGAALVELVAALARSPALRGLRPQA
jgi:FMN reductase